MSIKEEEKSTLCCTLNQYNSPFSTWGNARTKPGRWQLFFHSFDVFELLTLPFDKGLLDLDFT